MKIGIPKRHTAYLDLVLDVLVPSTKSSSEYLALMFKWGMEDVVDDLRMGAGSFPPDMDSELLVGKLVQIEIPYELGEDEEKHVKAIQECFGIDRNTVLEAFFLWALFDEWLRLKSCRDYGTDPEFTRLVDEMPHDACFEDFYYVASKNPSVFHRPSCHYVDRTRLEDNFYFFTREEAIASGRRPCKICNP